MGAFQYLTPNRSGPTMVRSPKSRWKAWTLASIAQNNTKQTKKKQHDTHATVTICHYHSLSAWLQQTTMNTRLKAILAFLCLSLKKVYHWTRCSSLITSDPLCTSPTPGFECPVALSQEAPTALMQTGKKEPRLINHDKQRRMAVVCLLLQLLFPLLTPFASLDFFGRWYHCWGVCL